MYVQLSFYVHIVYMCVCVHVCVSACMHISVYMCLYMECM